MGIRAALVAVWLGAAAASQAGPPVCIDACALARAKVAGLVAKFDANKAAYTSRRFSEAETRALLIDPFFEALGWDPTNRARRQLYGQDTIAEARLRFARALRRADYAFRIDARTHFFVEAKAVHRDIDDPDHAYQAKRYAWSSTRAELAVLTDFQTLRAFDARTRPRRDDPKDDLLSTIVV